MVTGGKVGGERVEWGGVSNFLFLNVGPTFSEIILIKCLRVF